MEWKGKYNYSKERGQGLNEGKTKGRESERKMKGKEEKGEEGNGRVGEGE